MFEPKEPRLQPVVQFLAANGIELRYEDDLRTSITLHAMNSSGKPCKLNVAIAFLERYTTNEIEAYLPTTTVAADLNEGTNSGLASVLP
jgi:hypothetical protein